MKFLFLHVEGPNKDKKKKLNLFQLANIKKIKKRNLALAIILLLVLVISAGGLSGKFFKSQDLAGEETKVHAKQQGQGKEAEQDNEKVKDAATAQTAEVSLAPDLENRLSTDFIKTLMTGNYVIRYKTTTIYEGQPYEVETTYAVSGRKIALVAGDRATVVRDNRVYVMNHTDKTIISWDVNQEKGSPERIDTNGIAYIGSGTEGGLAWEEYSTASSRLKLYFKGKELVKMVAGISKEEMTMSIVSVEKAVQDSLFEIPAGYRVTNI